MRRPAPPPLQLVRDPDQPDPIPGRCTTHRYDPEPPACGRCRDARLAHERTAQRAATIPDTGRMPAAYRPWRPTDPRTPQCPHGNYLDGREPCAPCRRTAAAAAAQ